MYIANETMGLAFFQAWPMKRQTLRCSCATFSLSPSVTSSSCGYSAPMPMMGMLSDEGFAAASFTACRVPTDSVAFDSPFDLMSWHMPAC